MSTGDIMKPRIVSLLLLIITAMLLFGCNKESQADTNKAEKAIYRKISAQEAKEIMDKTNNYVLVDVRTVQEFNSGHIEGAVLIPSNLINGTSIKELPDKKALILLYCRSGRRSADAAERMLEMGYTNIYDFGGIIDWPYEIIK